MDYKGRDDIRVFVVSLLYLCVTNHKGGYELVGLILPVDVFVFF
jgi:hypothetical protein